GDRRVRSRQLHGAGRVCSDGEAELALGDDPASKRLARVFPLLLFQCRYPEALRRTHNRREVTALEQLLLEGDEVGVARPDGGVTQIVDARDAVVVILDRRGGAAPGREVGIRGLERERVRIDTGLQRRYQAEVFVS